MTGEQRAEILGKRKSVKIYIDQLNAASLMPGDDFKAYVMGIVQYLTTEEDPAGLSMAGEMLYISNKSNLEKANDSYIKQAMQAGRGKEGGRPAQQRGSVENPVGFENNPRGFTNNPPKDKEKDKEKDKDKGSSSSTTTATPSEASKGRAAATAAAGNDEGFEGSAAGAIREYERAIASPVPAMAREEICGYWSGRLSQELIINAIREAESEGVRKWSYVETILKRYEREKVVSIEQARLGRGRPVQNDQPEPSMRQSGLPCLAPEPSMKRKGLPCLAPEPSMERNGLPCLVPEPTMERNGLPCPVPEPSLRRSGLPCLVPGVEQ